MVDDGDLVYGLNPHLSENLTALKLSGGIMGWVKRNLGVIATVIAGATFVLLVAEVIREASSIAQKAGEPSDCRYSQAELVESVVSGQTGQVISAKSWEDECYYWVRFAVPQSHTAGGFLFSGGPVRHEPLSKVRLNEFELRPAQR